MDYSLPDSSVNGILQAKMLEWVAITSAEEPTRNWTQSQFWKQTYLSTELGGRTRILIPRSFTVSIVVDRLKGGPQYFYRLVLKLMWNSLTLSIDRTCQFRHSVVSDSLWLHGLQHIKLPCPSTTPRACSNSCSLSQWCPPTISSSIVLFSSLFQSFPASGSFPMNQFFASGGQSIGVSASVLPMNI